MGSTKHHSKVSWSRKGPQVFFEKSRNSKIGTTATTVARPSRVWVLRNGFSVKEKGRVFECATLEQAISRLGVNMVLCPEKTGILVPEGDIKILNKHLKENLPTLYKKLQKEKNVSGDIASIYIYPDGYFTSRRFISKDHCPNESFATKEELIKKLKRVNPSAPSQMHKQKECPHGKECHG